MQNVCDDRVQWDNRAKEDVKTLKEQRKENQNTHSLAPCTAQTHSHIQNNKVIK